MESKDLNRLKVVLAEKKRNQQCTAQLGRELKFSQIAQITQKQICEISEIREKQKYEISEKQKYEISEKECCYSPLILPN